LTDALEEKLQRSLYESSVRDALTGAYNRKHFNERLASEVSYAVRHVTPLALLLLDIDYFKRVNDEHGHLAGDQVLRELAGVIMCTIRAEDMFARYGGEEFAVIARGSDARGAVALAERIRGVAETLAVDFEGLTLRVTISVGVATLSCAGGSKNVNALIARADEHLYEAKLHGRNRVVGPRA
jgi:diguanylate cyclase (GGDEF)-like protein